MFQSFSKVNTDIEEYISGKSAAIRRKTEDHNFKLEKLPLPSFSGNIRHVIFIIIIRKYKYFLPKQLRNILTLT